MNLQSDPSVEEVFRKYPEAVEFQIRRLRALILQAASQTIGLDVLEETLKWGEPSYIAKKGSTIRIDWKAKQPEKYAMYFKCTSKLVPTFKAIYGDVFKFEEDRAIVFKLNDTIPEKELKHCIQLALTYHQIKHLPVLGTLSEKL